MFNLWNQFWHAPLKTHTLVLIRICLISYLTFIELPSRFLALDWAAEIAPEFMAPGRLLNLLPIPFPFPELHSATFHTIMIELGICAVLGLFTRFTLFFFTVGYMYLAAIESAWGWHDHGPSLVSQLLLVISLAPEIMRSHSIGLGDGWDRRDRPSFWHFQNSLNVSRWGLQLVVVLVSLFYFTSGLSKIRYGGLEWLNGKTLQFYLEGHSNSRHLQQYGTDSTLAENFKWRDGFGIDHYIYGAASSQLSKTIAKKPEFLPILASGAVALELLYPTVLIGAPFTYIFFLSGAIFHVLIYFLMGIAFFPWIIINLCLLIGGLLRGNSNASK